MMNLLKDRVANKDRRTRENSSQSYDAT